MKTVGRVLLYVAMGAILLLWRVAIYWVVYVQH